jgi:hypothetical protein
LKLKWKTKTVLKWIKKIMLLNNLNLSTSYNLDADGVTSLAWSPGQS